MIFEKTFSKSNSIQFEKLTNLQNNGIIKFRFRKSQKKADISGRPRVRTLSAPMRCTRGKINTPQSSVARSTQRAHPSVTSPACLQPASQPACKQHPRPPASLRQPTQRLLGFVHLSPGAAQRALSAPAFNNHPPTAAV